MNDNPQRHKRQMVYIDHRLQNRLIFLFVILEVTVVGAALAVIYHQFNTIIEANLYRIHHHGDDSVFAQQLAVVGNVLLATILINILALIVADRIWNHHVRGIISRFRAAVDRVRQLDFSHDEADYGHHKLLDLTLTWRLYERQIWTDVRNEAGRLKEAAAHHTPEAREAMRTAVQRIKTLLKEG